MQLIIGNKNYSSWSMRPWLLLHAHNIAFEEELVSLQPEGVSERLKPYSGSAKVPVLVSGDLTVWDTLSICEFVNENYLDGKGWPSHPRDKVLARSVVAEMHSGFFNIRSDMPMNCTGRYQVDLTSACKKEIERIDDIWSRYARMDDQGNLRLFGGFSIADCFYAPVAIRFRTYGIELSDRAQAYCDSLLAHPSVQQWVSEGQAEAERLPHAEAGVPI